MTKNIKILWADDEIDNLKPQIIFLQQKGYDITPVTNGHDAIDKCKEEAFDVVFLDESMPGITGLETLTRIKALNSQLPIVMITKNEAEHIMEDAIGAQITDYLIKPVKPNQILLTLKKIIDNRRLVSEATTQGYQQEFRHIISAIQMGLDHQEWVEMYKKLVYWELELENALTLDMQEVLAMQKKEANTEFFKFINKNYINWIQGRTDAPTMSHNLFRDKILPALDPDPQVSNFIVLIDNLRYDQWKIIQPILSEAFRFVSEDAFYSILPTSTHYSRNAIFAGMMPAEIEKRFPTMWLNDSDEGGKNLYESDFLSAQLKTLRFEGKHSYTKITNHQDGQSLVDSVHNLLNNRLNVIVYNFVDMLSHARTEMEVLKELASDERAYRSITRSWFTHSPLWQALRRIEDKPINLIITTDHGTVRVQQPSKVIGDRNTTANLRYKHGKNLQYTPKEVLEIKRPADAKLPAPNVSSTFIFAREDLFFVYPNNYNHYVQFYKNTFQHGGVSLEEMIVPIARFTSK
ncbi:MAG: PglZ domain-containing protein [Chitinophagales bacterium]|nr:PglZ domain-containing protein [Chitinophagales bacterium]